MVAKGRTRRAPKSTLKQITLGILAWKSPKTLANTLLHGRPGVGPDGKNDNLFEKMENFLIQNLRGYTVAGGPGLFKHHRLDR